MMMNRWTFRLQVIVISGLFTIVSALTSNGAVIHVPADQPTIQAGIDAAMTADSVLVASGVYTGVGNRDIEFHGKAMHLIGLAGASETVIDCQASSSSRHRGFSFPSTSEDSTTVIQGFTVTNGYGANGLFNAPAGGAIFCRIAAPRFIDCIFLNNIGELGGAVALLRTVSVQLKVDRLFFELSHGLLSMT